MQTHSASDACAPSSKSFRSLLAVMALGLCGAVSAHGTRAGDLRIEHAYAMPTASAPHTWAVYFRGIKNAGSKPDRLLHASTPVATDVEMQRTAPAPNSAKVQPLQAIEFPANSNTPMRHNLGEYRLLLKELKQPLHEGERFELTLDFEQAGAHAVTVYVQSGPDAAAETHTH